MAERKKKRKILVGWTAETNVECILRGTKDLISRQKGDWCPDNRTKVRITIEEI